MSGNGPSEESKHKGWTPSRGVITSVDEDFPPEPLSQAELPANETRSTGDIRGAIKGFIAERSLSAFKRMTIELMGYPEISEDLRTEVVYLISKTRSQPQALLLEECLSSYHVIAGRLPEKESATVWSQDYSKHNQMYAIIGILCALMKIIDRDLSLAQRIVSQHFPDEDATVRKDLKERFQGLYESVLFTAESSLAMTLRSEFSSQNPLGVTTLLKGYLAPLFELEDEVKVGWLRSVFMSEDLPENLFKPIEDLRDGPLTDRNQEFLRHLYAKLGRKEGPKLVTPSAMSANVQDKKAPAHIPPPPRGIPAKPTRLDAAVAPLSKTDRVPVRLKSDGQQIQTNQTKTALGTDRPKPSTQRIPLPAWSRSSQPRVNNNENKPKAATTPIGLPSYISPKSNVTVSHVKSQPDNSRERVRTTPIPLPISIGAKIDTKSTAVKELPKFITTPISLNRQSDVASDKAPLLEATPVPNVINSAFVSAVLDSTYNLDRQLLFLCHALKKSERITESALDLIVDRVASLDVAVDSTRVDTSVLRLISKYSLSRGNIVDIAPIVVFLALDRCRPAGSLDFVNSAHQKARSAFINRALGKSPINSQQYFLLLRLKESINERGDLIL